jgi:hypothetical protein
MGLVTIPAVAASTTSGFSFKVPVDTTADTLTATNAFPAGSYYIPTVDTANIDSVTLGSATKTSSQIPATVSIATAAASVSTVPSRKWTVTDAPGIIGTVSMMSYLNGIFLAGAGGKIATSTDGLTWTTRNALYTSAINGAAYGNSQYLLIGDNGYTRASTNGITWTSRTSYGGDMYGVAFGNGVFCMGGSGGSMATSTDGVTWTSRNSAFSGSTIRDVIYAESTFVAIGDSGKIATSTDATTWTIRTAPNFTTQDVNAIIHDGSSFYVFGQDAKIAASTDGITWTTRNSGISSTFIFYSAAFLNNTYVAGYNNASNSVNILGSTDGITWTTRNSNLGSATNKYPKKLAAGNGAFIAGTSSNDASLTLNISRATTANTAFGKTATETFVTIIPVTEATAI